MNQRIRELADMTVDQELEMKDRQIQQLKVFIDELQSTLGWINNPDRSGGAFTQDEIDNAGAWR